jgi:hypothetical protein
MKFLFVATRPGAAAVYYFSYLSRSRSIFPSSPLCLPDRKTRVGRGRAGVHPARAPPPPFGTGAEAMACDFGLL